MVHLVLCVLTGAYDGGDLLTLRLGSKERDRKGWVPI